MLPLIVLRSNSGFTLIEVMIAFLITTIGLLALANVAVMTIDTNMGNMMRDEAIRIADERMNGQLQYTDINRNPIGLAERGLKTLTFDALQAKITANPVCGPNANAVVMSESKGVKRSYTVCSRVTQQGANSNTFLAQVWVGWNYKGGNSCGDSSHPKKLSARVLGTDHKIIDGQVIKQC